MRRPTLLAALALALSITLLPSRASAQGYYTIGDGYAALHQAAARWGVSYWWLESVAWCESRIEPWAYNSWSGASGLMQFMPGTYYTYARQIGEWRSLWNPYASANVAAYLFSRGYSYLWACA